VGIIQQKSIQSSIQTLRWTLEKLAQRHFTDVSKWSIIALETTKLMKPKFRVILEMAIEEGVRRGYSRAFKHNDSPTEGAILESIEEHIMSSIYEYFDFDQEDYQ